MPVAKYPGNNFQRSRNDAWRLLHSHYIWVVCFCLRDRVLHAQCEMTGWLLNDWQPLSHECSSIFPWETTWIISISPGFQFFAYFIASHLRLPSSILSSVNGFRVRWLSINVKSIWLPTKIMGHVQLKTLRIVICLQTSRGSKLAFGITNYCLQRHIEIEVEGNWDD